MSLWRVGRRIKGGGGGGERRSKREKRRWMEWQQQQPRFTSAISAIEIDTKKANVPTNTKQ